MAPVVRALERSPRLVPVVVLTGQHRSMLEQVNLDFDITADHNLDIMQAGQSLHDITARTLEGVSRIITAERPDMVLVQGDTTSALAAALAAFYAQVPVAHLEAGLRTEDMYSPYPEEMNRRLTSRLASLHLVPTPASRDNLLRENVTATRSSRRETPSSTPCCGLFGGAGRSPILTCSRSSAAADRSCWSPRTAASPGGSRCGGSPRLSSKSRGGFRSCRSCFRRTATPWSARHCFPSSKLAGTSLFWSLCRIRTSPGSVDQQHRGDRQRWSSGGGAESGQAGTGHA